MKIFVFRINNDGSSIWTPININGDHLDKPDHPFVVCLSLSYERKM